MDTLTKRELKVYLNARREGWEVLRAGWPDFLLLKDGKIKLVEVKRRGERLKPHQARMKEVLGKHFPYEVVYVY